MRGVFETLGTPPVHWVLEAGQSAVSAPLVPCVAVCFLASVLSSLSLTFPSRL